ncbi:hypothetical protein H0H92_011983 [Tricholoma furcatifolium]|nr:hypothetical protein H0H92_011983 [Tricholoma furcatifolium]
MPVAQPAAYYDLGRTDVQDERDSVSGSDDGNYSYHDSKGNSEHDGELAMSGRAHLQQLFGHLSSDALTAQTLNADGTPKRPMNAFMIFARRRRPQVSAENQAMRTGEISKILSKEWNNMEAAKKQFYQEQARHLKDNFNTKYPDYVYRRRPNNTRRKRKPEAPGIRSTDTHIPHGEDMGFDDAGDSPTELLDDRHSPEVLSDIHLPRLSHEVHPNDHLKFRHPASRASPYSYPSDSRASGLENIAYESVRSGSRAYHPTLGQTNASASFHSYIPSQTQNGRSQPQRIPLFNQNSLNSNENWNMSPPRPSSWIPPEQTHPHDSFAALTAAKVHRLSSSSWHRPTQASGNALNPSSMTLPTLSSPFFPSDSPQHLSPPALSQSISAPSYNHHHHIENQPATSRDLEHDAALLPVPLSNPASSYHSGTDRNVSVGSRTLSPLSHYSQIPSAQFPPHSSLNSQQGYWPKLEDQ